MSWAIISGSGLVIWQQVPIVAVRALPIAGRGRTIYATSVMPVTMRGCLPRTRGKSMTQPPAAPTPAGSRSPYAAHPVITAVIAILIIAAVFFSLYVPLYARATPMVGDFPFFYFFLLIY